MTTKRLYLRAAVVLGVAIIAALTAGAATIGVDETLRLFDGAANIVKGLLP